MPTNLRIRRRVQLRLDVDTALHLMDGPDAHVLLLGTGSDCAICHAGRDGERLARRLWAVHGEKLTAGWPYPRQPWAAALARRLDQLDGDGQ